MLHRLTFLKSTILPLGFLLIHAGCSKQPELEKQTEPNEPEPQLLEPSQHKKPAGRCRSPVDLKGLTLRATTASSKDGPHPVEVGDVVDALGGVAVGVLRSGSESRVGVEWLDGSGREAQIDLGVVHGGVEPPRLLGLKDVLIVALTDNDAGHSTIRLVQITRNGGDFAVTRGPRVQRRRSEALGLSLAAIPAQEGSTAATDVALVWEATEPNTLKSVLMGLTFSVGTMEVLTPEKRISLPSDDAAEPLLRSSQSGLWLTWLSYGIPPARSPASDAAGLVDEPTRTLKVQMLDGALRAVGEGLSVSRTDVLAFDGVESGGAFVILHRDASAVRADGRGSLLASRVNRDGSIEHGEIVTESPGLGAPLIFPGDDPWIFSAGKDDEVFLGVVRGALDQTQLVEEGALAETIPLHRSGSRLVAMRPRGLDLEMTLFECTFPPDVQREKANKKLE